MVVNCLTAWCCRPSSIHNAVFVSNKKGRWQLPIKGGLFQCGDTQHWTLIRVSFYGQKLKAERHSPEWKWQSRWIWSLCRHLGVHLTNNYFNFVATPNVEVVVCSSLYSGYGFRPVRHWHTMCSRNGADKRLWSRLPSLSRALETLNTIF